MVKFYQIKEAPIIVWGVSRINGKVLFKNVAPEEHFMEQTVSVVGMGCSLHECSDQQSQRSYLYIKEAKASIFRVTEQSQLTWFL